jgi:hypothetical protein
MFHSIHIWMARVAATVNTCRPARALIGALLLASLGAGHALAQDFQGPAGANYADAQANFGVTGGNIWVALVEHPLIDPVRSGIEPNHHLGGRFNGQWDFNGLVAPVWGLAPPPDFSCVPPPGAAGASDHATLVADVLAGTNTGAYLGVAPGVLITAGHIASTGASDFTGGYDSSRAAIGWFRQYGSSIIPSSPQALIYNLSFGYPGNDNGANSFALFLDWLNQATAPWPLAVVAAGDDGFLLRAPADLFDGLTVGYCDTSLQRRATNSSYALSPEGRAKPDLLAPGENISDGTYTSSGDSFSAPMVSGAVALLLDYAGGPFSGVGIFGGPQWSSTVRAIILNSARKRFISGLNATNGVSKDNLATANQESDYDYLDGPSLRIGGTGSGRKTEDWTPANWSKAADGPFLTTRPLDDEQGAGLLDVQRALTQMAGPGGSGHKPPGLVPAIGWDISSVVPPGEGASVQEYLLDLPITNLTFITATLCWSRVVYETDANFHPQRPPAADCPIDSALTQVDEGDTYSPTSLSHLNLNIYYGATLLAQSASPVDNLQHLHVPVPADGTNGEYRLEVEWVGGSAVHYSLAWWVGTPFVPTNQVALDFGQAPDPPYPTYLTNNGARHVIVPGFYLGSGVDPDADGKPFGADTDDDGVTFLTLITPGQPARAQVVASTNGLLNAWLDFNANGSWADAGDQIFTNQPLVAGTNLLSFHVPASATRTTNTFARFRFSSAAGLSYTGPAPDGEVEDYRVTLTCRPPTLTLSANGSNFDLTMDTQTNCMCYLEYKQSFTNMVWSPLQTVMGTGVPLTVTDTNPATPTRFYRVRVQ